MAIDFQTAGKRIFATKAGRALYITVFCLVAGAVAYNGCTVYVQPNQYGIKQVIYGSGKGIKPEIYKAGLHWVMTGTERMHVFPTDLQALNLSGSSKEADTMGSRQMPPLNIQTSEGYNVRVELTVLYRIEDPYKVITALGPGRLYEDSLVIPRSEQILRMRLGELEAEQFYKVKIRAEKVATALADLNVAMEPAGVKALDIFVRAYSYDEKYQTAIEQRKIQDQNVFKNKAEAEMATANAAKDKIVAEGDAQVKIELSRGDAEKRKIEAEADLYQRKQRSAGQLEVKLAEAEGVRLENDALRGVGSDNMVGLKMAEVMRGTKVIVVSTDGESGVNPLDLKAVLKRFDVKE
jgi:regulator of protease activity HflC (stomatin/prohibitin superfamily)